MTRRLLYLIAAGVLGFGMVGLACAEQPRRGGTLRIAYEADITGMDPHTSLGIQAMYVEQNLYNTLVTIDENNEFVPDLAESWEVQEDGRVYLFHLRKGVKFHDGADLTAEAVKWNFERLLNPAEKVITARYFEPIIEAVDAIDQHTLRIALKYPTNTLLPALAIYRVGFMIVSPEAYKKWGSRDLAHHPAGTGPFKLAKWQQNQVIELERNPNYFKKGLPYLDRLEFLIMKDGVTRATALRAGEVDFVNEVPLEHAERLADDSAIHVYRGLDASKIYIPFNVQRKPFDDLRVRQALAGYGISRQTISKVAFLGLAQPLLGIIPPGTRGHQDILEMYPFNPGKAKALLKEAGFDERKPLEYTIMTHGAYPPLPTVATVIKTQLESLGSVKVKVEVIDRPIFLKRIREHDFDQVINMALPFIDIGARSYLLEAGEGSLNQSNHTDFHVNALLDQWRRAVDVKKQNDIGQELQRYMAEHMLMPVVATRPTIQAARDSVKGYVYLKGMKVNFETTWLAK
ncbi:MAG TPA: ABC transporter substrate-binding protein [Alphaproteobacteria bacterium]|nr:ABC transporter substrate-binding protein [Alphaproteobacteria bacterium]